MALVLGPAFPDVDFAKLVKICIIHDLGEAIHGDVSAPEQARRKALGIAAGKAEDERRDLMQLLEPLPAARRDEIATLWDEYEAAASPEAKLAKALDKLETIMQHNQGLNPAISTTASTSATAASTRRTTRSSRRCGRSWIAKRRPARARQNREIRSRRTVRVDRPRDCLHIPPRSWG